jgi:cytochrome c556
MPMLESVHHSIKETTMKCLMQLLLLASFAASAQVAVAQKPEDAIKYRQGVYSVIGWNFGSMAAMVKGEKEWDQQLFARNAEIVAFMSKLPAEGFIPGSDRGNTKAKPEIWQNMSDFRLHRLERLHRQARGDAGGSRETRGCGEGWRCPRDARPAGRSGQGLQGLSRRVSGEIAAADSFPKSRGRAKARLLRPAGRQRRSIR